MAEPAHVPTPYITGYTDRISMTRGETVQVMVSCTASDSFEADLVRVRCGDLNPAGPGFSETVIAAHGRHPARAQICNAGSWIIAPMPRHALGAFTLQAHVWPTTPAKPQVLFTRSDGSAGFELGIDAAGRLCAELSLGEARVALASAVALTERQWHFVALAYDPGRAEIRLYQEPYRRSGAGENAVVAVAAVPFAWSQAPGADLLMAASPRTGPWPPDRPTGAPLTERHYNGKMEKPRLASAALDRLGMEKLRQAAPPPELLPDLLGFWDFSKRMMTEEIRDLSRNGLHGRAVNLPTRAMTGANWTGEEVNWRAAPAEYGAIHFHDDDIQDARWQADLSVSLPENLPSGFYAIRLTAGARSERLPLFVRPRATDKPAPVAFLASTATYLAYANLNAVPFPIGELLSGRLVILHEANLLIDEHPEWGPSLYDVHSDGSGVCYSSRLRPILNFRPGYISSFGCKGSNLREYNADTHIIDWLDATGQAYDVITDDDLHEQGYPLLERYHAVITGTHPEYFSVEMWDATKAFTDTGGRLMVMGGNGFYWRIAHHRSLPGVIEVRRSGPAIRTWETQPGEEYHSFDGKRGGLWRAQGRPPQAIGGVGFISEGFDLATYYRRTEASRSDRAGFIFEGVTDEIIGDFGSQGGGAAGIEIDHADPALGTPPHALILASSEGHTESYRLVNEEMSITVPTVTAPSEARIAADMVFFETPGGGAVFNTGSIAWAGSLAHNGYDNSVARITGNVLRRFVEPAPFPVLTGTRGPT